MILFKRRYTRKQTGNKWFETQDQIGYWDLEIRPYIFLHINLCRYFSSSRSNELMIFRRGQCDSVSEPDAMRRR